MKKTSLILLLSISLSLLAACGVVVEKETSVLPQADGYFADDYAYDEEMGPEDCFPGEEYDPQDKVCYIECDTEAECLAKEEEIYGNLDDYIDSEFGGDAIQPPDFADEPPGEDDEESIPLARYNVDNALEIVLLEKNKAVTDPNLADPNRHGEVWGAIRYLLPNDVLQEDVGRFYVFTDGPDNGLAYVEPLPDNAEEWQFGVDIVDAGYTKDFVHTLIHEFGHIVTLRKNQVPPDRSQTPAPDGQEPDEPSPVEASCRTFYTGEGCANPGSYINLFFERFWDDIFDEHVEGSNAAETQEEMDDFVAAFYKQYPDRFVSEYAATNPGEDIAETFAFFVLREKPDGNTIAEQKVLFFYEFEPLVKMRTQMRGQLARLDKN